MSFSYEVKEELANLPSKICCSRAELAAFIRMAGTIQIQGGRKKRILLQIQTIHAPTARRVYKLLKKNIATPERIAVKRNNFLKDKSMYVISVDANECKEFLEEAGIIPVQKGRINPDLIKKKCCKKAYLRGAFLGSGSISNPKGPYHMEFVTQDTESAQLLLKLIEDFGLKANITERKNNYMVYLKNGDHIADMLGIMGAHTSLLKYEDIRVLKEMRNSVNRIVNCETANINKTIDASVRQSESINYLKKTKKFSELPDNLKQIAELRLKHPDLSLKELGQMLDPVLGKSGVSYRLKKIEKIADKLQSMEGE